MSENRECHSTPVERIQESPDSFGLKLENSDPRRSIFSITDVDIFLTMARELGIDVPSLQKIQDYFALYPNALKQYFVANEPAEGKTVVLGNHHHTTVEESGSGMEIFIFTDIPTETNITLEQYQLGGVPRGKIMPGVKSGTVMRNDPYTHHTFTANGSFSMVQILEGGFQTQDLKKFIPDEWTPEEQRLVEGETTREIRLWQELIERKKGEYIERFPKAFEVLAAGGVHPDTTDPIANPYLGGELDAEDFRNVGEHCVGVSMCAEKIAQALLDTGSITQEDFHLIVSRALIHDSNKRFEVFRRKAKQTGKLEGESAYSLEAYEAIKEILKGTVDDSLLDYLASAGKETGHNSMADFVTLDASGTPQLNRDRSLAEMIVHIADDMVASPIPGKTYNRVTKIVQVAERMKLGDFENRYSFLYKEGFGFDEDGKAVLVRDVHDKNQTEKLKQVKTYAQWQKLVGELVCDYLKTKIALQAVGDAQQYIVNLVKG